jgi:hypothetical protein
MKRRVLVVDIGGTRVKLLMSRRNRREFASEPRMGPAQLIRELQEAMRGWGDLPYPDGHIIENYLRVPGLALLGKKKWKREVIFAVGQLKQCFIADYVVLGGGNIRRLDKLPQDVEPGQNENAFLGGIRLWEADQRTRRPKWRVV